jgi:uncharacterized protein YktB (UPF0637 family)
MYLSIIDNPAKREQYADYLAEHHEFPDDFVYSLDHTKPEFFSVTRGRERNPALARCEEGNLKSDGLFPEMLKFGKKIHKPIF